MLNKEWYFLTLSKVEQSGSPSRDESLSNMHSQEHKISGFRFQYFHASCTHRQIDCIWAYMKKKLIRAELSVSTRIRTRTSSNTTKGYAEIVKERNYYFNLTILWSGDQVMKSVAN